jgi:hypothetical protein
VPDDVTIKMLQAEVDKNQIQQDCLFQEHFRKQKRWMCFGFKKKSNIQPQ